MDAPIQQSSFFQEAKQFLSRSYTSNREFIKGCKNLYSRKGKSEEFFIIVLAELEQAISGGNIEYLTKLCVFIDHVSEVEDENTLTNYYNNVNNPIKDTNLVILASKHNKVKILEYILLDTSRILSILSVGIGRSIILPDDADETCHNAFYYAIRSGNVELLETLINKWPNNYFAEHFSELDEILSKAYEELKLKNVLLSEEIEIFVENKLIDLRFYSKSSGKNKNIKNSLNNIKERIELVLQNINLLKAEYSNTEKVDQKIIFVAKFIAQNIHMLKRQLKSTYDRLPWEEIEFCLISFVSSHIKQQEINLFYNATLNKSKLLYYLEHFAKKLEEENNNLEDVHIDKLANLPKSKREEVVAEIISSYPQFEELYNDYQQIRDIHSLWKINDYIKLALSIDPKQKEGQIIITRVLQVIGEYLKNTLESPKLSTTITELLLLSLPRNTRNIIIDLRNSLSHAYSLNKRTEIEENANANFFIGVQNDTKKIDCVIADILRNNKIKTIRILLKKIINSESIDEIKEIGKIFNNIELGEKITDSFKMMEYDKLEKLINELSINITDKTNFEKELFKQIDNILNFPNTKLNNIDIDDYVMTFVLLKSFCACLNDNNLEHNAVRVIKFSANKVLDNISFQVKSYDLKAIAKLASQIFYSARSRMQDDNLDYINRLTCEIFYIAEFVTCDFKWIEGLRNKLNDKGRFIPMFKQRRACNVTEENYNEQLQLKLSELKSILKNNAISGKLLAEVSSYKRIKRLQAVVEMLLLDIMSILGRSEKYLENNLFFLDDNTPLLTGKCLRNHLAHGNTLIDILLSDSSISVLLNAKKLVSENVLTSKKKNGKTGRDDPSRLKNKYNQNLITIDNQNSMFIALVQGNLEKLKICLRKGADINARTINLSTSLHIAAKTPSLEVIKFIINQKLNANVKDINGQNPLHIAAAHGRKNIVEYFIREIGLYVDDPGERGKTSLHIAAENGHKNVVEFLLKNNANTSTKDVIGYSPLHYAIKNNHIDVAKIMLEREPNVDINETSGGFTSLHIAAEYGYLELVNLLLKKKANVNAKNDRQGIPLHTAALNGHLEVVNALILKGADVNARVIDGCTSLHYAIENGHEKIANILLKHGANVNVADKTYNNTPLHYAAKDGYEQIVKVLLENKANANIPTVGGMTPLHLAAKSGHLNITALLIKNNVNIHARDKNETTPLHYAVASGHRTVAEFLIKNGAKINEKDCNNLTPLHLAALNGHKHVIELLISNSADLRAKDIRGNTLLHAAAMNGSTDIIDLLIKNKAEVDAINYDGLTSLYVAAQNGHKEAVDFLIRSNADMETNINCIFTPLNAAIIKGHVDIVNILINNGVKVNECSIEGGLPLFAAIEGGHKKIVEILITNGANVNAMCNDLTPLNLSIKYNQKEIVELLIENGAETESGVPIAVAVAIGHTDIVKILLKRRFNINMKYSEDATLLHLAAKNGHKEIVNTLIAKGANVDAVTLSGATPLYLAAQEGHEEVVEALVANKANVNSSAFINGTPLHIAAGRGYVNIIEILLSNGAKVNIKDYKNRKPLELAVANGHLKVVKLLLKHKMVDMNAKCNDNWTILHIASQENNLEMVKYLVDKGCDINAKNTSGSKPIHIAAREGFKDTVAFFLSKGLSIKEYGMFNQTLLHYAAMNGKSEVVKYLIEKGVNVNVRDQNGSTPLHFAALADHKDTIEILLQNGAIYNGVDKLHRKPIERTNDKDVITLLVSTEKLFESVKCNNALEVENCIQAGGIINAKNDFGGTSLHYAAWKGYEKICKILLQNKANPNVAGSKGYTPLHYAAKSSHLNIVKVLLYHGAVYNADSDSGKMPSDVTADKNIISLFKLISESFKKVKEGNMQIFNDLNKVKDIDTIKAVMSASNRQNETLIVAAVHSNFSKVEQLKQIWQKDVSTQINTALILRDQGNYQKALSILRKIFERRKEVLGPNNPGTLDIQMLIGTALYKQGIYQEALNMLEEVFQKQKEMLGFNNKDTLDTRSTIALVLHRQEKNEEAFTIFQEVYKGQNELLGSNHSDTINTQFHMALVLDRLGRYEEAININRIVFENRKVTLGVNNPATVSAQNNIAMVLANQKKYEESLKMYKEVLEKKKIILGINHTDTLRTWHNIAGVLLKQNKNDEALKVFQDVLNIQQKVLGQNHPETLNTQYNMANLFFAQGKSFSALKFYKENFDRRKAIFGPSHPLVLNISKIIEVINSRLKLEGSSISEVLQQLQKDINIGASKGDKQTVQRLLTEGFDANDKDIDGRTPLHYAVSSGHIDIVNILLKNGADVNQVTNKGNTPLHTAASNSYKEIVEVLLQHISPDKLNNFVNAKTTASGSTSLHVAAKTGSLDVVKLLLKHGATYNIENKEGKAPIDVSKDQNVINLLKLIDELFRDVKHGSIESIRKLQAVKADDFLAITNARNNQGNSLLQVAIANKYKNIASELLRMLKETGKN